MQEKRLNRFFKIFPIYNGLSLDLLFYAAIGTLFLTVVKELTVSQISLLTTISLIAGILMQIPLLKLIEKIGNNLSIRLGVFCLFLSSAFLTFSPNFIGLIIGMLFSEVSFVLKNMSSVALKNNLEIMNKSDDFIPIQTKSFTIYSFVTFVIALMIGPLFNINHYLPMYLCIIATIICFILSFFIFDITEEKGIKKEKATKQKANINKMILLIILSFGLFYGALEITQNQDQLFIQYFLSDNLTTSDVANYLGIIIACSRGARIISNLFFNQIYNKLKDKVEVGFSIIFISSFVLILLGKFLNISFYLSIILMSIGFFFILTLRDPYKAYSQDLLFRYCNKGQEQALITYQNLSRKIFKTMVSIFITIVLYFSSLTYAIIALLLLALVQLLLSIKIYNMLK